MRVFFKYFTIALVFTGLVIFVYTAIKQPIPDFQALKLVVWGLLLGGIYIGV